MTQGLGPSSRGAGLRPTRTVTRTPDRLGPTVGGRWRTVTVSDSAAAWQARSESVTVTVTVARPLPPGPGAAGTVTAGGGTGTLGGTGAVARWYWARLCQCRGCPSHESEYQPCQWHCQ